MQFLVTLALQVLMVAGLLKWVLPSISRNRVTLTSNDAGNSFLGAASIVGFQTLFSIVYGLVVSVLAAVLIGGGSLAVLFAGNIDVAALSLAGIIALIVFGAAAIVGAFLTCMGAIRATGRLFPQALRVTATWGQTFLPALLIMVGDFVVSILVNQIFPVA